MNAREIVQTLSTREKAALLAGKNFWELRGLPAHSLPEIMMTDGPHGLRKQAAASDHLGLNASVPATCFPTASATGNSFDRGLLAKLGEAIGEECRQEGVAVVLGPGANIKRSPLCGRNFEYFSEDPLVSGELAAAMIQGVQSKNVGTSLKHFALNNQETRRMTSESVSDDRAIREIYLAGFERAVKQGKPWTVMCAYNLLYSELCSQNKRLLTDILRGEWGFEGLTVTDWGAALDRVQGVAAGLDLEMPYSGRDAENMLVAAAESGTLPMAALDASAERVVALILRSMAREKTPYDQKAHHRLARSAAAQCCVLLKNDGLLPCKQSARACVIGGFAKHARYQGAGSSKVNSHIVDSAFDEIKALCPGADIVYAQGYPMDRDAPDAELIREAVEAARGRDIVYLFCGLPDRYESEGFDRDSLELPECHNALVSAVAKVNPNIAVVLMGGGVMDIKWQDDVRAILFCALGGEAVGGACADVLLGVAEPGGRLAESWPLSLKDNPSYAYFPGYQKTVEYRESIFVGYRYYDTADAPIRFPFGYGLSYTQFSYADLVLSKQVAADGEPVSVSFTVTNTGKRAGSEIAQLYVAPVDPRIYKPAQELRGFERVTLAPGETKRVTFTLDRRAFAHYDTAIGDWAVEGGEYEIRAAASSRDIRLSARLRIASDASVRDLREQLPCYYNVRGMRVTDDQFVRVLGRPLPARDLDPNAEYTINSTICDIQTKALGRFLYRVMCSQAGRAFAGGEDIKTMAQRMLFDMPLRTLLMVGGDKLSRRRLDGLVDMLNGHRLRGLQKIFRP